jgi:glycerophosphoryl diester phosphodiesterase
MLVSLLLLAGLATAPPASPLAPPKHGGIYVVAHRGAHNGIPENTVAAYRAAAEMGVDFVEVDLRETKDGQIVSVHNAKVDDYTKDATGLVKTFTLAELKAMDIGSRIGPEWKDERIPTFDEILDAVKGKCGIYLDLKDAPVPKLLEIIRAHGMEREVIWYAGPAQQKQVASLCPECHPMPDPGPEAFLGLVLKDQKPKIIASDVDHTTPSFVETCHKAGAIVIADDSKPEDWETMLAAGVDGIQTDEPAELIAYLKKRAADKS